MKYVDTKVVFREVPDEVTLAINISNCPVKCPGCHSSYLANDIGDLLDETVLEELISKNPGISCVSFMGGDADPDYIGVLSAYVKRKYPKMKTCWYSGRGIDNAKTHTANLDYVKVGPYIDEYGPLDSPNTNQRFYAISHTENGPVFTDLTHRFKKRII